MMVTAASEDFSGTRTILVRTLPFHRVFLVISIRQDVVIVNHPPIDNVYLSEWSLPTLSKYICKSCMLQHCDCLMWWSNPNDSEGLCKYPSYSRARISKVCWVEKGSNRVSWAPFKRVRLFVVVVRVIHEQLWRGK